MILNKKMIAVLIMFSLAAGLGGCSISRESKSTATNNKSVQKPQSNATANRFQEPVSQSPTAVESAIELSQKYAKLSEDISAVREKNKELTTNKKQLEKQLSETKTQLAQAKKELGEANNLLIEMRIELNNWKIDILGFRDEMRDAEKMQLDTLLTILQALGGETKTDKSESSQPKDSKISGEPNE
ncbi:MAG: hypothetical protein KAI59_06570 [Planctomycetes bacterium]|nr:hypothetical protein [Planctomycetota bacterium]MCK5473680.1 hypothetical protein [Planctomycetota bacterium]